MAAISKKLVIVEDGAVGKTCLIQLFLTDQFLSEYVPTIVYNNTKGIEVDGKHVYLDVWETVGSDDYDRVRPLAYPNTGVIFMCFSIDLPQTLENIDKKWTPEIRRFLPKVPIVLLGNKNDIRNDHKQCIGLQLRNEEHEKIEEGRAMAKKIGAVAYFECSALHNEGVWEVFEEAIRATLSKKKSGCTIQ